eukprot:gb/GECH01009572.1/.p1 GENE.gb/GECH01009572.1/~~gb/GECH01009572.1/.p1  ORF type:complete len:176 (+),score=17.72 gb/GECH01009572.1/:1-528(+)
MSFVTEWLGGIPLFLGIIPDGKAETLINWLEMIKKGAKQIFSLDISNNTVIIDNDKALIKALETEKFEYIHCKFHLLPSWVPRLNHLPQRTRNQTLMKLYRLYNSTNEKEFDEYFSQLKELDEKFSQYMEENYYNNRKHWASFNRPSRIRLWNTNNYTEALIKSLETTVVISEKI